MIDYELDEERCTFKFKQGTYYLVGNDFLKENGEKCNILTEPNEEIYFTTYSLRDEGL